MAAVIDTQAKTTQNKIHSAWRNSVKKFCNLPTNTSRNLINQIFENQELTCELASIMNESMIQKRNKTLIISVNQQNITEEKLNTRLQHETRRRNSFTYFLKATNFYSTSKRKHVNATDITLQ